MAGAHCGRGLATTHEVDHAGPKTTLAYWRAGLSSARIRASVGGWVLKRLSMPAAENGLMMNMCAVAGLASSGTARDAASIFLSALTRPPGLPAIADPPASASYSREREMAA